jgi:hypothetical protein
MAAQTAAPHAADGRGGGIRRSKGGEPLYFLKHAERMAKGRLERGYHFIVHGTTETGAQRVRIISTDMAQDMLAHDHNGEGSHYKKPDLPHTDHPYLLADALTASSGERWRRMRPAVERALGGGLMVLRQRHSQACAQAAQACCDVLDKHRAHGEQRAGASAEDLVLDVRVLAAAAAGRGMTVAAVGGWGEDAGGEGREVDAGVFDREAQRFVSRARTGTHEYLHHHAHMHSRM